METTDTQATPADETHEGETPEDEQEESLFDDTEELSDDALVDEAHERYRLAVNAQSEWRQASLDDLRFLAGDQWEKQILAQRDATHRPALTINRLPQFLRQITNEQRQAKPAITVNPVDSGSDIKTAEVFQGIVRNIEYRSNAEAAYQAGGQSAAATGLGYWDVRADYEDERSFEQTLGIHRILSPHSCVMDPGAKEVAGDDARWVVISADISKAEWQAKYPDRDLPTAGKWEGEGEAVAPWAIEDGVRLHEYRWIGECRDTLFDVSQAPPELQAALQGHGVDLSSGSVLASEVGDSFAQQLKAAGLPSRETGRRQAYWARIAGDEVLERGELAGRYLQLVRVVGAELVVDGKTIYEGIVRHAKGPQKMLNFYASGEAELIALAPKSPWVMAEGQDEGYETDWANANTRAASRLRYRPKIVGGQLLPPPQRVQAEANVSAITSGRQLAAQDLNDVTGIYPTQFGAPSPEQSGKAILARQTQGQTTNFHFLDNLAQAIRYTGRILIDLIPLIYSGPRIMRILGEDGKAIMVPVNGADGTYNGEPAIQQDGRPLISLESGKYDVAVSMGPSYISRRQQAAAQLLELLKVSPVVGQVASDKVVLALDIPGGQEIADRIAKTLPPEIRPPDEEKTPPPQVLMQRVQEQGQLIQQMTQKLHYLSQLIETEELAHKSKEKIALWGVQAELVKAQAALNSKEGQAMLDRTHELVLTQLEIENQPPEVPEGVSNAGPPGAAPGNPIGQPGAPGAQTGGPAGAA